MCWLRDTSWVSFQGRTDVLILDGGIERLESYSEDELVRTRDYEAVGGRGYLK